MLQTGKVHKQDCNDDDLLLCSSNNSNHFMCCSCTSVPSWPVHTITSLAFCLFFVNQHHHISHIECFNVCLCTLGNVFLRIVSSSCCLSLRNNDTTICITLQCELLSGYFTTLVFLHVYSVQNSKLKGYF